MTIEPVFAPGGGASAPNTLIWKIAERLRTFRICDQISDDTLNNILEEVKIVTDRFFEPLIANAWLDGHQAGFDDGAVELEALQEEMKPYRELIEKLAKLIENVK